jgi:hypothetical protein
MYFKNIIIMKQMYYLIGGIAVIAIVCFLCSSCSKDEGVEKITDDKVSVDKTELNFSQKDENQVFSLFCMDEWHLEAEGLSVYYGPNMADVRDFTIAPISGKGNIKVTVTLNAEQTESYVVDLKVVGKNSQAIVKLKTNAN